MITLFTRILKMSLAIATSHDLAYNRLAIRTDAQHQRAQRQTTSRRIVHNSGGVMTVADAIQSINSDKEGEEKKKAAEEQKAREKEEREKAKAEQKEQDHIQREKTRDTKKRAREEERAQEKIRKAEQRAAKKATGTVSRRARIK